MATLRNSHIVSDFINSLHFVYSRGNLYQKGSEENIWQNRN